MEDEVIITAAVTGSFPTRKMNPNVPYTPREIADAAVQSHKAGAAIVHVHVRDPETGEPAFEVSLFQEVFDRIREKCDIIINFTTSGLRLTGPEVIMQRLQPVYLKPDICSLDLGSINFHDRVFNNPPEWSERAAKCMRENHVKPEIEVFEPGHIRQAVDLIQRGLIDQPPYFQLCMGVKWGIEASAESLLFMKNRLPSNALWSVLGTGKSQLPMITMSLVLGGNVRVGFEDNVYLRKGVLAKNNAQAVEMAVDLAERLGRRVATASESRRILGLRNPC